MLRCTTATALCDHAWLVLVPKRHLPRVPVTMARRVWVRCVNNIIIELMKSEMRAHTEMYNPNDDYQSRLEAWALTEIGLKQ